jgi:predicted ATPase
MEGKRLIEKIRLRNILSFGDKGEEIELQPLNIIIGQNASGKSNLVDVIKLLRSLTQDRGLVNFISKNGGISEWLWKGNLEKKDAEIEILFSDAPDTVNYSIVFGQYKQRLNLVSEKITNVTADEALERKIIADDVSFLSKSLGKFIEKEKFFAFAKTRSNFANLAFFTDIETNRSSDIRKPQSVDTLNSFLEENGGNLCLVLDDLEARKGIKIKIIECLKRFNPRIENYSIEYISDFVQLYIHESSLQKPISAYRLSDGTLRYLCLLAILCHPEPPPLICIEEPEMGLHPDILPTIAELMKDAAQRTQLIVTTHSDILVSAFSDMPEAVLVCEKDEDGTHFRRLEAKKLKTWLEEYTLGEAWLRGAIGGTRW